jgi:hypothetical protein
MLHTAPHECLQTLADILRDVLNLELPSQGHRLTIALEKAPTVLAISDVCLKCLSISGIEVPFEVIQNEIDYMSAMEHTGRGATVAIPGLDPHKPCVYVSRQPCPRLHDEAPFRSAK